jgi:TatD DNase family protein
VIDTHAHLDALDDPSAAVVRAREAGVTRILTVGTSVDGCRQALAFADGHEEVYAVLGIHPHEAGEVDDSAVGEVHAMLGHPRAVAVGEIGLDYYRDYAPRDAQRRLFDRLLAVADETGTPVVIHTRAADEDTLAALAGFAGTVVLHCFSSPALLPAALERGYYVSFAGNVTFPKASDLRVAATRVPFDRLLAETDTPYLAPQPVRGRRNEPANVMHTLAGLAEARGNDPADLAAQIEANAVAAFGLPPA